MIYSDRLSLLVMSCDSYSDTWVPFFLCFEKYFPRYLKAYLGTETKDNGYAISIGSTGIWTKRLRETLQQIDTKYVLFMLDDFFIRQPVDINRIKYILDNFDDNTAVFNFEKSYDINDIQSGLEGFKIRSNGSMYMCSCQPSIWDREKLIELLDGDMNPQEWEMRYINSPYKFMINSGDTIIDIGYTTGYFNWGIVRGQWSQEAIDFLKSEKITISQEVIERRGGIYGSNN